MVEVKVVGRGVDILVLNVCYTDEQFQPIKQELDQGLQNELNVLQNEARENEAPLSPGELSRACTCSCKRKVRVDNGAGQCVHLTGENRELSKVQEVIFPGMVYTFL